MVSIIIVIKLEKITQMLDLKKKIMILHFRFIKKNLNTFKNITLSMNNCI